MSEPVSPNRVKKPRVSPGSKDHLHGVPEPSTDRLLKSNGEAVAPPTLGGARNFAVLEHLPAAVYTTDAEGRITFFNEAAAALWGRRPNLGEAWCGSWRLYWPDGRPMAHEQCPMARSLRSGEPIDGEGATLERPDGSRVDFLAYPKPLRDASGKPAGGLNMLLDVTDRRTTEDAIHQREAELTDLVENTTVGLHRVGPDGTILWANQAEMDLLGVTPDDYIGHHIAEFHADGPVIDDILDRLARFETLKDYRARLRCKDGSIKHVLIDSSVYTKNGQFVHTRCFTRDISAQLVIERRLAVSAAISQILSEAVTVDEAAPAILETLSEHFDADILELWLGEETLRCVALHSRLPDEVLGDFKTVSEHLSFGTGEGLPGRVRQARKPIWLDELSGSPDFTRHHMAGELGLGRGVGIPILIGEKCLGVITCLMRGTLSSDASLLNMMASIGLKLGQFLQRTHEEEVNRDLAAVVEATPDAIASVDIDDVITTWNPGAERLFGYSAEEAIGQPVSLIVPRGRTPERIGKIAKLKRNEIVEPHESVRVNRSGDSIPVSISYSGIRDPGGRFIGAAAIIRDISSQKALEAQLQARVRQLGALFELGMLTLVSDDLQDLLDRSVAQVAKGLDVDLAKVLELQPGGRDLLLRSGVGWTDGLVGRATVSAGLNSQAGYTLTVDQPVIVEDLRTESRFSRPNLHFDHGVVSGLSVVIRGEGEKPFGVLGAHTRAAREFSSHDVHFLQSIANVLTVALERKALQNRQSLLVAELSHRVKNILTVILAIASQTGRQSASVDDFLPSFEGRLQALSQAHDLLTANQWGGASLDNLAQFVLGSQADKNRLHFHLDNLELNPSGTQAMAMVFHELMTNAVKYGALSNDKGTITLVGGRETNGEDDVYRLSWQEEGGPPVSKPERSGFGSQLIAGMVKNQCGGKLVVDWRPEGLTVVLEFPQASIAQN